MPRNPCRSVVIIHIPFYILRKKRFTTVKTPGVMLLMSSRGMDPYRLHTSRQQKPWMSPSISNKNSMKSSVFFKCAGICLSRGLRDLVKYLESLTGQQMNDGIKFTIELPTQNNLPYLDTLVSFNPI